MKKPKSAWIDFYDLLEVSSRARVSVIEAAYKELVAEIHGEGKADRGAIVRLTEARETLIDVRARREYDQEYQRRTRESKASRGDRDEAIARIRSSAEQVRRAGAALRMQEHGDAVERQGRSDNETLARLSDEESGFVDKLKRSAMCRLGRHKGEWYYDEPDVCTQSQMCSRCGEITVRSEHAWSTSSRIIADGCEFISSCTRCTEESEIIVEHTWSWKYIGPDCQQAKRCDHCAEADFDSVRMRHDWNSWHEAGDLVEHRLCKRCAEKQTRADRPRKRVWINDPGSDDPYDD